jgi:hypothetical protein
MCNVVHIHLRRQVHGLESGAHGRGLLAREGREMARQLH